MIRKLIVNPLARKSFFVILASLLHYIAIIRTHVHYLHQTEIQDDNIILNSGNDEDAYRMLYIIPSKNASTVLDGRVQRELELPMFNVTGGLIIFIHIAKTGGSSIREGFRKIPNINVKRIMNEAQLNTKREKIDRKSVV